MPRKSLKQLTEELKEKLNQREAEIADLKEQVTSKSWYQPYFWGLLSGVILSVVVLKFIF